MNKREAWIAHNAGQARAALERVEVGADDSAQRRERRLEAARRELARLELRWRVEDEWT